MTTDVLDASGYADFAWFRFRPLRQALEPQRKAKVNGSEHEHGSRAAVDGARIAAH
jgi:hypothetical protein